MARSTSQGIPDGIKQPIELNAKKAKALQGTTMAARLLHMKECLDLLAVCVHDNKPVHLLSMVAESVEWNVKKRKAFHRETDEMKEMGCLWLNIIDDYNSNMNAVDIADQLRGMYRPDHWIATKSGGACGALEWCRSIPIKYINSFGTKRRQKEERIFLKNGVMPSSLRNLCMI